MNIDIRIHSRMTKSKHELRTRVRVWTNGMVVFDRCNSRSAFPSPHREVGPSTIYPDGSIMYYVNGLLHRPIEQGSSCIRFEDDSSITRLYHIAGRVVDPLVVFSTTGAL